MIALDTNILVHAHRPDAAHHVAARDLVHELAESVAPWAIPWPCIYEFLRVVTHPRGFRPPSLIGPLLDDLEALFLAPGLILLGDGPQHRKHMLNTMRLGRASSDLVFDAHIAALVVEHGITELYTLDRDFRRFPGVVTRNPFDSQ